MREVLRCTNISRLASPSMDPARFAAETESHRRYLMRVAQLQLRDHDLAQDVVQDTLVAALSGAEGFDGRSSLKTWLTGILKHKIVDAIRRKQKAPVPLSVLDDEGTLEDFDALFKPNGAWEAPPADWGIWPEAKCRVASPQLLRSVTMKPASRVVRMARSSGPGSLRMVKTSQPARPVITGTR